MLRLGLHDPSALGLFMSNHCLGVHCNISVVKIISDRTNLFDLSEHIICICQIGHFVSKDMTSCVKAQAQTNLFSI